MSEQIKRYEDELTFTEFVESMAVYLSWVKRHWMGLLLCGILGAAACVWYAKQKETQYEAKLTFVLNDQNNPQISSAGGILSQLGLPISSGRYNIDRLLGTAKSKKIVEATLLTEKTIDGTSEYLANHFLNTYDLPSKWKELYPEKDFFFITDTVSTEAQSYALQQLYLSLVGSDGNDGIMTLDYGKTDYIMSLTTKTPSEDLSLQFTKQHYDEVSSFYVNIASEHNHEIYKTIASKRDSIKKELDLLIGKLAALKDHYSNSFRQTSQVSIAKMEAHARGLSSALESAERYVSQAGYALQTSTPLIQKLDDPRKPLTPLQPSALKYGVFGLAIGISLYLLLQVLLMIFSKVS